MKLLLLIMSIFLFNGCFANKPHPIKKEYTTQEIPKLRVMNPLPKYYVKYYPLDNIWYKAKKTEVHKASRRAMQRRQQNKVYTHDAKTFNELYHNRVSETVDNIVNKYLHNELAWK